MNMPSTQRAATRSRSGRAAIIVLTLAPLAAMLLPVAQPGRARADSSLVPIADSVTSRVQQVTPLPVSPDVAAANQLVTVSLTPRNAAMMRQLATAMVSSANPPAALSDAQIQSFFSPTPATYTSFIRYFSEKGLSVSYQS